MSEIRNTSDDVAMRVDHVLNDLRSTLLDDRMATHGHPGLFAHTFAGMMRPYLAAMAANGRQFADSDTFAVMELVKLAREATTGASEPVYDHPKDAAGYAILRAAYSLPRDTVEGFYREPLFASDGPAEASYGNDDEPETPTEKPVSPEPAKSEVETLMERGERLVRRWMMDARVQDPQSLYGMVPPSAWSDKDKDAAKAYLGSLEGIWR